MRVRHHLVLAAVAVLAVVGPSSASESAADYIYPSGTVQAVFAFKKQDGSWTRANARIVIGLQQIPGARGRGFDRQRMVIDLTGIGETVPSGCGIRLERPWKDLRASFPKADEPPEFRKPATQKLKASDPETEQFQTLTWQQGECIVSASFYPGGGYGGYSDEYMKATFPGLDLRTIRDGMQVVTLTLKGSDRKAEYKMVLPYSQANWLTKP